MTELCLPEPGVIDRTIEEPRAWTREQATEDRWRVPIPAAALDEIAAVIEFLRVAPLEPRLLSPDDYALHECRQLMRRVEALLSRDLGIVVLDRLPVARYSKEELVAVYWLLSSMIARPVAQAYDGRVLYDVLD